MRVWGLLLILTVAAGCGANPPHERFDADEVLLKLYGSSGIGACEETNRLWQLALSTHLTVEEKNENTVYLDALQTSLRKRYITLVTLFPNDTNNIQLNAEKIDRLLQNTSADQLNNCADLMLIENFFIGHITSQFAAGVQAAKLPATEPFPSIFILFLEMFAEKLDYFSGIEQGLNVIEQKSSFGFSLKLTTERISSEPVESLPIFGIADGDHPLKISDRIIEIAPPSDFPTVESDLVPIKTLLSYPNGLSRIDHWIENSTALYLGVKVLSKDGQISFLNIKAHADWIIPSVDIERIDDRLVIKVREMSSFSAKELQEKLVIQLLFSFIPIKAIILDLRWNPGGYVNEFEQMAGYFLGAQQIASAFGRHGYESIESTGEPIKEIANIPLAVLINQRSASAAELLAMALQSSDRAVVIGERSFGKAIGQSINISQRLRSLFNITSEMFFDSNGKTYQMKGLSPDIEIPDKDIQSCLPKCVVQRMEDLPSPLTIKAFSDAPAFTKPEVKLKTRLQVLETWTSDEINKLRSDPAIATAADPTLTATFKILEKLP